MNNPDATEILVHVSAASGAADDAKYRQQARAFLQFAAARKHKLTGEEVDKSRDEQQQTLEARDEVESEDLTSSVHNEPSASEPTLPSLRRPQSTPRDGLETSPVVNVARTPAVQVSRTPAALGARASVLKRPRTAPAAILETPIGGDQRRPNLDTQSWNAPPSIVPDSQPSQLLQTKSKRTFADAFTSSISEDTTDSPIAKKMQSNRNEAFLGQPAQSSRRQTLQSVDATNTSSQRSAFDIFEPDKRIFPAQADQHLGDFDALKEPLSSPDSFHSIDAVVISPSHHSQEPTQESQYEEILIQIVPPPPPTSSDEIGSHLTPTLISLTKQVPVNQYFVPVSRTRELRPLERGSWRFEIPISWTTEQRSKFWKFIQEYIGSGRAGWGVSVERLIVRKKEQSGPAGGQASSTQGSSIDNGDGFVKETVTTFCWGEVAAEIWLVLWVASNRKLKGLGSKWVDGGEEVVITME